MLAPWERRILRGLLWRLPLLRLQLALAADPARLVQLRDAAVPAHPGSLPPACTQADFAARCAALVALAARQPLIAATCLPQALALQSLLQQHGVPAQLRLGAARAPGGRIAAHAWVEHAGVVLGADVAQYTPFRCFSPADAGVTEHQHP